MEQELNSSSTARVALVSMLPAALDRAALEFRRGDFVHGLAGFAGYLSYKAHGGDYEEYFVEFEKGWHAADATLRPRGDNSHQKMTRNQSVATLAYQLKDLIDEAVGENRDWKTARGKAFADTILQQLGQDARRYFSGVDSGDAWSKIQEDFNDGWRVSAREETVK